MRDASGGIAGNPCAAAVLIRMLLLGKRMRSSMRGPLVVSELNGRGVRKQTQKCRLAPPVRARREAGGPQHRKKSRRDDAGVRREFCSAA